jgi:REP element-mobilizing transposase RayT
MMGKMPTGMIMALNNTLPYRRSIRLAEYDYRQPGAYFITVCTHGRAARFGSLANGRMHLNDAGQVLHAIWQTLPEHYPGIALDAFVVMPDHIHGIIVINDPVRALLAAPAITSHANTHDDHGLGAASSAPTLGQMMRRFKSESAIAVNRGTTPGHPLWQRNYWERILRDERECAAVRAYIRTNPQRG